jgi:hypothetical protein
VHEIIKRHTNSQEQGQLHVSCPGELPVLSGTESCGLLHRCVDGSGTEVVILRQFCES